MKISSKVAATALLAFTLFPAVAANAQTDCARADYCNPETPDNGGFDDGVSPRGEETSRGGESSGGTTDVRPGQSEAGDAAEAGAAVTTAPSGALPITGSDVVGIAALGAAAVGLGTVLVKRSKSARQTA